MTSSTPHFLLPMSLCVQQWFHSSFCHRCSFELFDDTLLLKSVTILFRCLRLLLGVCHKFLYEISLWQIWICCKDNYAYCSGARFTNAKTSPNRDLGLILGRVCFAKLETCHKFMIVLRLVLPDFMTCLLWSWEMMCFTYPPSLVTKYRDMVICQQTCSFVICHKIWNWETWVLKL